MQKISYTSALTSLAGGESCAFGDGFDTGGEGWMDDWFHWDDNIFSVDLGVGGGCNDPFGGMGGSGGENCSQCRRRESNNCQSIYESDLVTNTGVMLIGVAACTGLTAGIGAIACVAVAAAGGATLNASASMRRDTCLTNVSSKCETKC